MRVSAIIPAYNEAQRIEAVVQATQPYVDEALVMDDGSTDGTGEVAERAGARVIFQANERYLAAVKHGFLQARGQIVVTLDADGEHCPRDIPRLIAPILANEADLVLGARSHVPRFSERLLNWLTRLRVKHVSDTGTGFRAMRRDLAIKLELRGRCICGISVLEAAALGARVAEIPVDLNRIDKSRRIAWFHLPQVWHVVHWLLWRGQVGWAKREQKSH